MTALAVRPCRAAMSETYQDVDQWISVIVSKFYRRYGGDFQELKSEANLTFIEVFPSWDPDRSQFRTYLHLKVWDRLFHKYVRAPIQHQDLMPRKYGVEINDVPACKKFCTRELLESLSDDGRELVGMCLNEGMKSPDQLWNSLKHEWTAKRFIAAFDEVKRGLQ